jgi:diguanylate cyclase (GGDEF)-like protein
MAARYGGEEFVLLLVGSDGTDARDVAEHIRSSIETLAIPHRENGRGHVVTISIGVATATPVVTDEEAPDALVSRADQALYAAKAAGGNCVIGDGEIVDPSDFTWNTSHTIPSHDSQRPSRQRRSS